MSYDGIVMRAVMLELNNLLPGARIDKIFQPNKHEINLTLRQPGQSFRLLLSVSAQEAGVYLTSLPSINPQKPPQFCMLLRKHLEGGRISSFSQNGMERLLEINCDIIDELGEQAQRKLIVEVMGKHSNIILLDPRTNRVYDAIQRVTPALSRYRQVLPGLTYQLPPPQEKLIPWEVDQESFYHKLLTFPLTTTLSKALLASFSGFGPQSAEEIVCRSGLDQNSTLEFCGEYELSRLWQVFSLAAADIKDGRFSPEIAYSQEIPCTFSALALTRFPAETRRQFSSISQAIETFYSHKKSRSMYTQKIHELQQVIKKETDRCEKKAALQMATILEAKNAEHYRLWGELLTANAHNLSAGNEAIVTNYYSPEGEPETIPLNENLSIMENAQRYFSKYQKAKNSAKKAQPQYEETRAELAYLASLTSSLDNVTTLQEIEEIKEELREYGYLKTPASSSAKRKATASSPSTPQKLSLEGWEILVGKNNKQNDLLVTKLAKPDDLWLHTKDIPGSHVLIKNPQGLSIPPHILEKAALLAAYHSKARYSKNVPVDYTLRKHVWKLKGAKPGMVHYENQRTVYITPEKETAEKLLKNYPD